VLTVECNGAQKVYSLDSCVCLVVRRFDAWNWVVGMDGEGHVPEP